MQLLFERLTLIMWVKPCWIKLLLLLALFNVANSKTFKANSREAFKAGTATITQEALDEAYYRYEQWINKAIQKAKGKTMEPIADSAGCTGHDIKPYGNVSFIRWHCDRVTTP